jgi:Ca-activated chloride channel homolog
MTFAHPALAWMLVPALLLAAWALRRHLRWRRQSLEAFGDPSVLQRASSLPSNKIQTIRQIARLAALALLVLALARPQFGERPASLAHTGRDVLVLLDLSRSMNAEDAGGPRLEAAKALLVDLLARSPDNRFGLVVFGGSAFLQLPLTSDLGAFQRFLAAATTDDLANPSTDLARALSAAVTTFEHEGERGFQTVLLLSDGESAEGDVGPALKQLRQAGIPVITIGVGTEAGAPVPADSSEAPEKWHRDHIGRIVQSKLEEGELRRAALETGGEYLRWAPGLGAQLASRIAKLEKRTMASRTSPERADRFQWPLLLAILILGTEPLLARRRRLASKVSPALLAASALIVGCSPGMLSERRGERLYSQGNFREAYAAFQKSFEASGDPALQYNLGVVLYRLRQYQNAATMLRESAAVPELKQRSYYNLGNAYVRLAEEVPQNPDEPLRQAIGAYEEALRLDPSDSAAKWNLELALQRRGEDRESGGSSGRGRSADYGQGNMNVPGYEGNAETAVGAMAGGGYGSAEGESAEELSEAEARALLEAMEREQLTSHEGRQSPGGGGAQKDW